VATNMAGRGTDIKLGPGIADLGGLHVICSEVHDSARIDRQLIGRCGRQGDPGSYRQYQALDDDVLEAGYDRKRARKFRAGRESSSAEQLTQMSALFQRAQGRVERQHHRQRMILLYHEQQRKRMQEELGQDPYLDTPH